MGGSRESREVEGEADQWKGLTGLLIVAETHGEIAGGVEERRVGVGREGVVGVVEVDERTRHHVVMSGGVGILE